MNQSDASPASSRTILVVEDEFFIALEIKAALTSVGYKVLGPASSVDHALERVTPVAIQLKALGVPFVLASAADPGALAKNAILAGVRNLGKPTDMRQLASAVAEIAVGEG